MNVLVDRHGGRRSGQLPARCCRRCRLRRTGGCGYPCRSMRLTRHVTRRLREVRRGSPTFHPYLVEQTFTVSGSALGHQPFVPGHFGAAVVDVQVGGVRVDPDLPADLSGERVVGTRTLTGPARQPDLVPWAARDRNPYDGSRIAGRTGDIT